MVKFCSSWIIFFWESMFGFVLCFVNRFLKIDNMEDYFGIKDCFGNVGFNWIVLDII